LKGLCLEIGPEGYAVETSGVVEVIRKPVVTPLPESSVPVKGIFLYRTNLVPLIDETLVFGIATGNDSDLKVVVLKGPEGLFGIEAKVEGVFEFEGEPMGLAENIPEGRRGFLKGLLKRGQKVYGLINIDAFVLENLKTLEG
jgi:chemotaxis signal transduction protein